MNFNLSRRHFEKHKLIRIGRITLYECFKMFNKHLCGNSEQANQMICLGSNLFTEVNIVFIFRSDIQFI